jgi:hypothetical protein
VFLGRARYQRSAAAEDARPGIRNGYSPATVKTTAGPVTVARPKLLDTTAAFASKLLGSTVTRSTCAGVASMFRMHPGARAALGERSRTACSHSVRTGSCVSCPPPSRTDRAVSPCNARLRPRLPAREADHSEFGVRAGTTPREPAFSARHGRRGSTPACPIPGHEGLTVSTSNPGRHVDPAPAVASPLVRPAPVPWQHDRAASQQPGPGRAA